MKRVTAIVVGIDHWEMTNAFCRQLVEYNPGLDVLLIDNASEPPYPTDGWYRMLRLPYTVGYNNALNAGLKASSGRDWWICLNNDCQCTGEFMDVFNDLDPLKVYGSGDNVDTKNKMTLQWSAWLVISREAHDKVGGFDPELDGAYEDFDYQLSALALGFGVAFLPLPIIHLDKHTRMETHEYQERWKRSHDYFNRKWDLKPAPWFK